MNRLPALLLFAVVFVLTLGSRSPAADPLPKGAKARLGTTRMRDTAGWNGAALAPGGKHLVAASFNGPTKFDVTTGEPAGKIGRAIPGFGGGRLEFSADGKRAATSNFNGVV